METEKWKIRKQPLCLTNAVEDQENKSATLFLKSQTCHSLSNRGMCWKYRQVQESWNRYVFYRELLFWTEKKEFQSFSLKFWYKKIYPYFAKVWYWYFHQKQNLGINKKLIWCWVVLLMQLIMLHCALEWHR